MFYINNPEVTVSLVSLFVALLATLFVLYQAHLTRVHNRLSVRPKLSMEIFSDHDERSIFLEMRLTNIGLGPALIKNHDVYFDRHLIGGTSDISACRVALEATRPTIEKYSLITSVFSVGTALRSGEARAIVKYVISKGESQDNQELLARMESEIVRFDAKIIYECMYGFIYALDTRLIQQAERV